MNTQESTSPNTPRPLGFWITAVDRLMKARFATAFEDEGVTRRDWRILNALDGSVPTDHAPRGPKLRRLAALGWISRSADGWTLTDEGAAAKARLGSAVDEIRAEITGTLSADEFAALTASLEKIARGLGWSEGMRLPRRERRDAGDRRPHRDHDAPCGHGGPRGRHGGRHGFPRPDRDGGFPGFAPEAHGSDDGEHPFSREERGHRRGRPGRGFAHRAAPHIHVHLHGRHDG
ncbi:MarR family winged helix-turn-helix transcriptional regulator [uncultured Microbacterium sp.]|uniref:MarR family winged helix-turn-helix transcriptional regulator n=1 Tax=uncultured Microbacterium sp. TaxID=191216 RepID=UPI0025DD63D1|nr:hypothetical protein [uncultured Microbacterium sp.]